MHDSNVMAAFSKLDSKVNYALHFANLEDFIDLRCIMENNGLTYADLMESIVGRTKCTLPEELIFSRLSPKKLIETDSQQLDDLFEFFHQSLAEYKISLTEDVLSCPGFSVKNLTKNKAGLTQEFTKDELNSLGFTGRFWSTSNPVTLVNLAANILCEPRSFREVFKLAGIIGIKPLQELADRLKKDGELNSFYYSFYCEHIELLHEFLKRKPHYKRG